MNVNLTPTLEQMVRQKVASGFYNNASEVIREALRALEEKERHYWLKTEVAKGAAQLAAGRKKTLDMEKIKKAAIASSKLGRKVKQVVKY